MNGADSKRATPCGRLVADFRGRAALVTGGAQGIGAAIAGRNNFV